MLRFVLRRKLGWEGRGGEGILPFLSAFAFIRLGIHHVTPQNPNTLFSYLPFPPFSFSLSLSRPILPIPPLIRPLAPQMQSLMHPAPHILNLLPCLGIAFQPQQYSIAFGDGHGGHVDTTGFQGMDKGAEVGAWRAVVSAAGLENYGVSC